MDGETPRPSTRDVQRAVSIANRLVENVELVIRGKEENIRLAMTALLCGGHILLEDVPGTGKTMLVKAMMRSIEGATFSRIQGTPDLRPTDITGLEIFNQKTQDFELRKGPILRADGILVDEINRMMPKTQSALLEAMEEKQTTIGLVTYRLRPLFFVAATQNPLEYQGTYPLPEAQRDRFFLQMEMGYPNFEDEVRIIRAQGQGHPIDVLGTAVTVDEVRAVRDIARHVYLSETLEEWIVRIVQETRNVERHGDALVIGTSVRGSEDLAHATRAWALLSGRDAVRPSDIETLLAPILGHRIFFKDAFRSRMRHGARGEILAEFFSECLQAAPLDIASYAPSVERP